MPATTRAAATAAGAAYARLRSRIKYEGGGPLGAALPASLAQLILDYNKMSTSLAAVKADAAYASLQAGPKALVDADAPYT